MAPSPEVAVAGGGGEGGEGGGQFYTISSPLNPPNARIYIHVWE